MKLSDIKGLKEKRIQKLNEAGIFRPEDLILHFPHCYFDVKAELSFFDGDDVLFRGTVTEKPKIVFLRRGLRMVKAKLDVNSQTITATWFNQPYIANTLTEGKSVLISGRVKKRGSQIDITAPTLYNFKDEQSQSDIIPIYRPIKGLPYSTLVDAIRTVLINIKVNGFLTADICQQFEIIPLDLAIKTLHFPCDMASVRTASKSVAIENLSYTISVFNILKSLDSGKRAFFYDENSSKLDNFFNKLPFELTLDQNNAIKTIVKDLHSHQRMNRLVQGDVGCGKTLVAFAAMYYASLSGYQSVLMSPTEILARQHYQNAIKIFDELGLRVEYLSGSQTKIQRESSLFNIKHGNADIIIGTHALISESVEFNNLSLVITDEQQRFGVSQRATLENKSKGADTLVMTATPIPRTLGLTFYGDLDQVTIKEMPKNRPKISTHLVQKHKIEDMYSYIKKCAENNMLTYIVCPRIEDEDEQLTSVKQLHTELKERFGNDILGLLHGQMKEKEKIAVMEAFNSGKIKVLLSTTVVEVGIDVKNAVNMVIFDPERYGLSQLHQLRGRVGRGTLDSFCFLVAIDVPEESKKRLEHFVSCRDGFALAEYDFLSRGAGDFLGTRQHGQTMTLVGETLTTEIITKAKAVSDCLLSYPNTKAEIERTVDDNKMEYIKNITLN